MKAKQLLGGLYGLFFFWHNRPFAKPLSAGEVARFFEEMEKQPGDNLRAQERERFRQFLEEDDGQPFYMVNLMQYRAEAHYRDGAHPDVKTGQQANALYSRAVLKELLKRGSYPVLLARKIGNFIDAGAGTDFFEEVGIVRYRSRRDLMQMSGSEQFLRAEPHKWASLEKTVVVPTRKLLLLDLNLLPLLLGLVWLLSHRRGEAG